MIIINMSIEPIENKQLDANTELDNYLLEFNIYERIQILIYLNNFVF